MEANDNNLQVHSLQVRSLSFPIRRERRGDGVSLLFLFLLLLDMMYMYLIENCEKKTDETEFSNECRANPRHAYNFCTDCYVRNNLLSGSQAKDDLEYFVQSTGVCP